MTSLKPTVPPVNLKERIAALQQKNAGQTQRPTSPPLTSPASASSSSSSVAGQSSNVAALREKIAKFEKKGGVPVPRGSFGLGAPPPDSGQPKAASRELYGNRIPAPVKPQTTGNATSIRPQYTGGPLIQQFTGPANSRSPSPSSFTPPSPPLEPIKPTFTGRRGTQFAKAMDIARKAEAENQQVYDPRIRETSISPPPSSPPPPIIANRRFSAFMEDPPTIIVSPQLDSTAESESTTTDPVTVGEPGAFDEIDGSASASTPTDVVREGTPSSPVSPNRSEEPLDDLGSMPSTDSAAVASAVLTPSEDDTAVAKDGEVASSPSDEPPTLITNEVSSQSVEEPSTPFESHASSKSAQELARDPRILSSDASVSSTAPVSDPVPQVVCMSPQEQRVNTRPLRTEDGVSVVARQVTENVGVLSNDVSRDNDISHLPSSNISTSMSPTLAETTTPAPMAETSPATGAAEMDTTQTIITELGTTVPSSFPSTPLTGRDSFLSSESIDPPSHRSSLTESPGHLTLAHRVSPVTGRGVPMFLPGSGSPNATSPKSVSSTSTGTTVDIGEPETKTISRSQPPPPMPLSPPGPKTEPKHGRQTKTPKTGVPSAWSDTISPEGVEFGTVIIDNKRDRPVPMMVHPRSLSSSSIEPEPDFNPPFEQSKGGSSTFSAVVHNRSREKPASYSATLPRAAVKVSTNPVYTTPQKSRPPVLEEPLFSPGLGDLALLVEQSAMLEQRLVDGFLPDEEAEGGHRKAMMDGATSAPARAEGAQERERKAKLLQEERDGKYGELKKSRSSKSLKGRASEDSGTGSRRKPSFSLRNPLPMIRSRSTNRKDKEEEVASLGLGRRSTERLRDKVVDGNRSKSMYLTSSSQPSLSTIPPVPAVPASAVAAALTAEDIPPTPPPKSPGAKYLSSFRRFASTGSGAVSRSQYPSGNAAQQRHSVSVSSEISSEDSIAVVTPPDSSLGFGVAGVGLGAPPRPRTSSGNRSAKSSNEPWPSSSSSVESSPKKQGSISRATSFAERMFRGRKKSSGSMISTVEFSEPLPIPEIPSILPPSPSLHELIMPETSFDSLQPPSTPPNHPVNRASWVSTTTNGSSLLFDKDMFDAFPSVPQTVPSPMTRATIAASNSRESLTQAINGVAFPAHSSDLIYGKPMLGRAPSTKSTSTLGPHNITGNNNNDEHIRNQDLGDLL